MKKSNIYLLNDEIDLSRLIKYMCSKKFIFLITIIIFGLSFYFYGFYLNKTKNSKVEITIVNPSSEIFKPYKLVYSNLSKEINEEFINDLNSNILYLDNLDTFLEQSEGYDDFKIYLKSINSTPSKYFKDGKLENYKKNNLIFKNKFILACPKELNCATFLTNYIAFNKNKTINEFKKKLKLLIEHRVNISLEIIKSIQLQDLNLIVNKSTEETLFADLVNKEEKLLSYEIIYYRKLLLKLENEKFNYNHLLNSASFATNLHTRLNPLIMSLLGIFFGIFLFVVIIILKDHIKIKSKNNYFRYLQFKKICISNIRKNKMF
jgi:hypothetical protein